MSLTIGNKTSEQKNPGGTTWSHNHNHSSGVDGYLFLSVTSYNNATVSAKYNNVSMTQIRTSNHSSLSQRWTCFGIANPPSGTHAIKLTFSASVWNPVHMCAVSFTNCAGVGNSGSTGLLSSPHTKSLTVSEGSIIFGSAIATAAVTSVKINNINELEFTANTNKHIGAGLSSTLSAGSYDIVTEASLVDVTNHRVEILGTASPPSLSTSASLSSFTYAEGNGPSSEQSFTVSGSDLTANATVTAPTNYEVATTSGGSFGTSVSLTPSSGTLSNVSVYVRLKAGLVEASYNENITVSSTGATNETVALSGSVSEYVEYYFNVTGNGVMTVQGSGYLKCD
jgi:hypothetical protein